MSICLSLTLIAAVGAEVGPTNSGVLSFPSGREASWNPGGDAPCVCMTWMGVVQGVDCTRHRDESLVSLQGRTHTDL